MVKSSPAKNAAATARNAKAPLPSSFSLDLIVRSDTPASAIGMPS